MKSNRLKELVELHDDIWDMYFPIGERNPDVEKATKFIDDNSEKMNFWQENEVFVEGAELPEMIFKNDFDFGFFLGGELFDSTSFNQFTQVLKLLGEEKFFIYPKREGETLIDDVFSFSSDVTWEELMSGDFISFLTVSSLELDLYLCGTSGTWGIFLANNFCYELGSPAGTPIKLWGVQKEYYSKFCSIVKLNKDYPFEDLSSIAFEERPNLTEWIPPCYFKK
jgi:hypothetical protein